MSEPTRGGPPAAGTHDLPAEWERLRRLKNTMAGVAYSLTQLRAQLDLGAAEERVWAEALVDLNNACHALNALVARRMRDPL